MFTDQYLPHNTKLATSCVFSKTRPLQLVDAWPRFGSIGAKRPKNTKIHFPDLKLKRESITFAAVNVRSYLLIELHRR